MKLLFRNWPSIALETVVVDEDNFFLIQKVEFHEIRNDQFYEITIKSLQFPEWSLA